MEQNPCWEANKKSATPELPPPSTELEGSIPSLSKRATETFPETVEYSSELHIQFLQIDFYVILYFVQVS